ncbi:MAG: GIY-YIG nuclease family protein [Pseudomonadaceae bacterium]|nr:MAG: GIY-YIG nuclease family protein [Pseudomonadaceae bacterium]
MPLSSRKHTAETPVTAPVWWVYMVRAENGHLYTGISTDPQRRFEQHCNGRGARFFNRSPAQALVWQRRCSDHGAALREEIAIKRLKRSAKERLINQLDATLSVTSKRCAGGQAATKLGANKTENPHE